MPTSPVARRQRPLILQDERALVVPPAFAALARRRPVLALSGEPGSLTARGLLRERRPRRGGGADSGSGPAASHPSAGGSLVGRGPVLFSALVEGGTACAAQLWPGLYRVRGSRQSVAVL